MRTSVLAAASVVLLAAASVARADAISTFDISGQAVTYGLANDFNTLDGSVTIDTTDGVVEAISFTAGGVTESGVDAQYQSVVFVGPDAAKFTFTGNTLVDFTGGTYNLNGPNDLYVGWVTNGVPVTGTDPGTGVAPEPSSIALLGTGLFVAALLAKRRYRRTEPVATTTSAS